MSVTTSADKLAELLRNEEPEALASRRSISAVVPRAIAPDRGQRIEIELGEPPHQVFALDLERREPAVMSYTR